MEISDRALIATLRKQLNKQIDMTRYHQAINRGLQAHIQRLEAERCKKERFVAAKVTETELIRIRTLELVQAAHKRF